MMGNAAGYKQKVQAGRPGCSKRGSRARNENAVVFRQIRTTFVGLRRRSPVSEHHVVFESLTQRQHHAGDDALLGSSKGLAHACMVPRCTMQSPGASSVTESSSRVKTTRPELTVIKSTVGVRCIPGPLPGSITVSIPGNFSRISSTITLSSSALRGACRVPERGHSA